MKVLRTWFQVIGELLGLWVDEVRTGRSVVQAVEADATLSRLKAITGSTALADDALEAAALWAALGGTAEQLKAACKIVAAGRADWQSLERLIGKVTR